MARQEELRLAQQKARRRRQIIFGAVVVVILGGLYYLVTKNGGTKKKVATTSSTTVAGATTTTAAGPTTTTLPPVSVPLINAPASVGCPNLDGSSPHYTKFTAAPPTCIDATKTYTVTLQTDAGNIIVKLDPAQAPVTVNSFVFLVGYHFYDGTAFHRVIPGFVDQGGDPTGTGGGGPGYQFKDELPTSASQYVAGSLAMANSGVNTNGSQFFIVIGSGGAQLSPAYSLFGQVTGGLTVATAINNDGTSGGTPKVVHKILKATVAVS
jgi:cyclophilin family peptidyl-prolyl cis-trans isomerase